MVLQRVLNPSRQYLMSTFYRSTTQIRHRYKSVQDAVDQLGQGQETPEGTSTYGYRTFHGKPYDWAFGNRDKNGKFHFGGAGCFMFVMWYWILYKCMTDYGHLKAHHPPPKQEEINAWTDEELGIPPDDYEE